MTRAATGGPTLSEATTVILCPPGSRGRPLSCRAAASVAAFELDGLRQLLSSRSRAENDRSSSERAPTRSSSLLLTPWPRWPGSQDRP